MAGGVGVEDPAVHGVDGDVLDPDGSPREFGAGYAGFVTRYAFLTGLPIYPSLGVVVGGGAVVLSRDDDRHERYDDDDDDHETAAGFFVAQPELALHANLARWLRLSVTAGYRFASDVKRFHLTKSDLDGVVLGGNLQFGWF